MIINHSAFILVSYFFKMLSVLYIVTTSKFVKITGKKFMYFNH